MSTADTLQLLLPNIWKLHGILKFIVSDRGPQFILEFWKELCKILGVERWLSTAFHPQPDWQTEQINAIMKQYLWAYVSYKQNDWTLLLALAEFALNNYDSKTTGISSFFAVYGYHPWLNFNSLSDQLMASNLEALLSTPWMKLQWAQDRQETNANKHQIPAPVFLVESMVWLSSRNIRTLPFQRVDWKHLGKFKV